ncbi:MAG: M81 family metallopeptidase, partial [Alphaproteobacteria bacterium]|nr:M81 family metallopeptidase [Alphaproteobacteria bacterium]
LLPLTTHCTLVEPTGSIYEELGRMEKGAVSLLSFTPGFVQADISDCGPAVIAHAADRDAAEKAADALAGLIVSREREFGDELLPPEEAVSRAMAVRADKPVVIADAQDNPGAGGTSDTTGLLRALVSARAPDALLGLVFDPDIALVAHKAGRNSEINVALGGKTFAGDPPFQGAFTVENLSEGRFTCTGPFYSGINANLGPTALLRLGGVRVVVTSKRMQAADQMQFRHVGAEPKAARILGLKSSVHFRADFQPIAERVLVTAAPGAAPMDPRGLPYRRLRKGVRLYPGDARVS